MSLGNKRRTSQVEIERRWYGWLIRLTKHESAKEPYVPPTLEEARRQVAAAKRKAKKVVRA